MILPAATTRTALLGLRAANAWRGEGVTGLRGDAWSTRLDTVRATDANAARGLEAQLVRRAAEGFNGLLAWHALPGFGAWAAGPRLPTDPAIDPWDPTLRRPHTVVVTDPARRFQPIRLALDLPLRDLVKWTWGTNDTRPTVRAYAAPTHPTPDGYAAIRATLWDPERGTPAAWALLDVSANGHVSTGLAGEDGAVVVFLPVPRPRAGLSPVNQAWPLAVSVRYGRLADLRVEAPLLPGLPLRADLPTLAAIEGQPAGALHRAWTDPATHTAFAPPDLRPGGEALLASDPQPPAVPLPSREHRLFVTP